ncbi:zinc finger HIT domain-containing protein 2-like [Saccostrea cucullata]|uniref:zinc finger HIT domain-containing protein 2-like n=1 Tax=Saccostrea cuccullata TaxID=36930 RepID=UPI002ED0A1E7
MERKSMCEICKKDEVKYTCPRCNVRYCGLTCYRDELHTDCSEAFYKDCCMEALENEDVSSEEKQKMLEMLDRLEKEDADNELEVEECEELSERLTGLNLDTDTDQIWNRLTDQEKAQFNKMVKDGHLGNLVEIWTPWWNVKEEKISEVDSVKETQIPAVIQKIPDISKLLTKSKPSADIRNNIVNVLYAYVFVCRLYNGTHWDCPQEAALKLVNASDVLTNNSVCSSPSEAVQLCMANRECQQSQDFLIGLVDDVVKILQGPGGGEDQRFVMAAISDILKLLKKCHSQYKKDIKLSRAASSDTGEEKQLLYRGIKKVEFYLAWCQKCGMALLSVLPELRLEYSRLIEELEETNQVKESVTRNLTELRPPPTGSKLIEELT